MREIQDQSRNIYQRVNAVMQEVTYVQKDAVITGGGANYKAVTHDMVTAILRSSLVENGIVIRLEQTDSEILVRRDVEKNVKMMLYSGMYNVHFVNIDKPEDFITVTVNAHAADNGDKAPGKAASYAVKVAQLKLFSLETGENDESRAAEPLLHSDIQKAQFDDLLSKKDGLGMTIFSQTVGHDVMSSLTNTFKKGEISSSKALLKELINSGFDDIIRTATQISDLIANDDPAVTELTGELEGMEKRLVAKQLSKADIEHLKKLKQD